MSTANKSRKKRKVAAAAPLLEAPRTPENFVQFIAETKDAALGLLETQLLPWLSINDQSSLGSTCCSMKKRIIEGRHRIAREERQPTKMRYDPWGGDFGMYVSQVQRFRFIIAGTDAGKIQVNINLVNRVYDERHNARDVGMCIPLNKCPEPTNVDCKIYRENLEVLFRTEDDEGYSCKCGNCIVCRGYDVQGISDYWDDSETDHDAVKKYLDVSAHSYFLCAKRVSEMTSLPIGYIIRKLPSDLHPYIPEEFDWNGPHEDRITVVEWEWRPANTVEEWWHHALTEYRVDYDLDELPWYRHDYFRTEDD